MTMHARAGEYLDGVLSGADEEAFLEHLASCAACQAELHGEVQLRDHEDTLRAAADRPVVSIERARGRRAWLRPGLAMIGVAAAAAAVVTLRSTTKRAPPPPPSLALTLAPTRSIETRLAWQRAAAYRRYDTMRGVDPSVPQGERIEPRVIAQLTEAGDCAGIAATYVLRGELVSAQRQYDQCGDGAALDADRAGLAVLRRDPATALELADRALAIDPEHAVALWNRGLALRELGLGLAAAVAFERVGALDPPWATEAAQRAASARAPLVAMRDGYRRVVEAGATMVAGGPPIPAPLARQFPGRARLRLDDAIRVATTAARLAELRPLAAALDGLAGDGLVARLDAARPTTAPPALVATYVAWITAGAIAGDDAWPTWLAAARRARADALIVGAVLFANRLADAPEAAVTVARSGDAALIAFYEVVAIQAADAAGRRDDAEARLVPLEQACAARTLPDFPCQRVAQQRATIEFSRYRAPATAAATAEVLRLGATTGEWSLRWRALYLAGNAERIRGAAALAIAHYDEYALSAEQCDAARLAATVSAEIAFDRHRLAEARRRLAARPACGTSTLLELLFEVDLARAGEPVRPVDALLAELATITPIDAQEARYAAYLEARARLGTDPDAPGRLRAIAASTEDRLDEPGRPQVAQLATGVLAIEAGRAARWAAVVADVARWSGAPPPSRCAIVLASEDHQFVAVAIDPSGALVGAYQADRSVGDGQPLPPAITDAVRGCAQLDVVALPPWLGADLGLDPALPWRFGSGAAAAPTGAAHRVIVVEPRTPAALGLAPLGAHVATAPDAEVLRGDAATVTRVAAAARDATLLEIHAHTIRGADSDAPVLALADGPGGWAATAERVAAWSLPRAPVVLLADCDAGQSARYEQLHWSLPRAFLEAGAATVVAALVPVPDAEADVVFAQLGDAIAAGEPVAAAVARIRAAKIRQDPASWLRHVVVFE